MQEHNSLSSSLSLTFCPCSPPFLSSPSSFPSLPSLPPFPPFLSLPSFPFLLPFPPPFSLLSLPHSLPSSPPPLLPQIVKNPVENGLEMVLENVQQLKTLINRIRSDSTQSTNPLTMKLNGTLDAAVNGGVSKFEVGTTFTPSHPHIWHMFPPHPSQVFFSQEFLEQNPKCKPLVPKLRLLMEELVNFFPVTLDPLVTLPYPHSPCHPPLSPSSVTLPYPHSTCHPLLSPLHLSPFPIPTPPVTLPYPPSLTPSSARYLRMGWPCMLKFALRV